MKNQSFLRLFKKGYNDVVPQIKNLDSFKAKSKIKTDKSYKIELEIVTNQVQLNLDRYNSQN